VSTLMPPKPCGAKDAYESGKEEAVGFGNDT